LRHLWGMTTVRPIRDGVATTFVRLAEHQRLLRLLIIEPGLDYKGIGSVLGVPQGTIGPTWRRCLDQVGRTPEVRPYIEGRAR